MAESNLHALDINLIAAMSEENEENPLIQVSEIFVLSPWYSGIVYVLQNFSPPPGMAKNKSITLKLKAAKFCKQCTLLERSQWCFAKLFGGRRSKAGDGGFS